MSDLSLCGVTTVQGQGGWCLMMGLCQCWLLNRDRLTSKYRTTVAQ